MIPKWPISGHLSGPDSQKFGYIRTGFFPWPIHPLSFPSLSRIRHLTTYIPVPVIVGFSFLLTLTLLDLLLLLLLFSIKIRAFMSSTQNTQPLPSFNVALCPSHYKTVLTNLSYPSRPHSHIPWSRSSAPLSCGQPDFPLYSSQAYPFWPQKPRVISPLRLVPPVYKLAILFFTLILNLTLMFFINSDSHGEFRYLFSSRYFWENQHVDLGEVDQFFCAFLFRPNPFFFLACSVTCQWLFEHSNWFGQTLFGVKFTSPASVWASLFTGSFLSPQKIHYAIASDLHLVFHLVFEITTRN